jgi:hypothetical protein
MHEGLKLVDAIHADAVVAIVCAGIRGIEAVLTGQTAKVAGRLPAPDWNFDRMM